jgi:hypothetical protein
MTKTAPQNASTPAYLLAKAGGVLLRSVGGWTTEPSEAKAFREITPELFEIAELFDVSVIKLSTTGDVGQIEIYTASAAYAAVEIRKRRGSLATFRIRTPEDEHAWDFIVAEEVEEYIACLRLALSLANLLP